VTDILAALALLACGYLAGIFRPWKSARSAAFWVLLHPRDTRVWRAKAVIALVIQADHYATALLKRRRGDGPPERRPAPTLRVVPPKESAYPPVDEPNSSQVREL
jgi:hypothetical protein